MRHVPRDARCSGADGVIPQLDRKHRVTADSAGRAELMQATTFMVSRTRPRQRHHPTSTCRPRVAPAQRLRRICVTVRYVIAITGRRSCSGGLPSLEWRLRGVCRSGAADWQLCIHLHSLPRIARNVGRVFGAGPLHRGAFIFLTLADDLAALRVEAPLAPSLTALCHLLGVTIDTA